MAKFIRIAIYPDGRVQADVEGVKGKACTDYIGVLKDMLKAEVIESHFTLEYFSEQSQEVRLESTSESKQTNRGEASR